MADWEQCTLGNLFTIKHGYAFKGEYFGTEGSHIVLTPGNFREEGGFKEKGDKEKWYSGKIPEDYILSCGDLIVVMTEQGEGLLGSSAIITQSNRYLHNQRLGLIQNLNGIDKHFLYYLFNSQTVRQQIRSSCSGVKVRHTSPSRIYEVKVSLPPLSTQQKIASILSAYDDLIENNTKRIKILEEMAQTIYNEWFVKFRFPSHESVKMVESELGMIPDGWEVRKLPDLCSKVIDGTHDSPKLSENGYFLVTGKHIVNGFIDFSKCYMISPEEHTKVIQRSKPEKGDIIFSNIGTLGSTVIVDQDFEFSIKNVALFKPLQDLYSNYLYLHFSSPETYNRMERKASGTSQKFFSLSFLRNIVIMEPPKDLLHKFDKIVKPLIEERSMLNKKNQNLRKTRDLLLPKLISGEIDVSELDIDVGGITE